MKPPVFRIEQSGEVASQYPTLTSAMRMPPRSREACITTKDGIHLADALPCASEQASFVAADGSCLCWRLTLAGQGCAGDSGAWTLNAPTLSPEELDGALAIALGDELKAAS